MRKILLLLSATVLSYFPCLSQSQVVFYGLTMTGGQYNYGTAFSCTSNGTFNTLNSLDSNGINPYGSFIKAYDGNYYAMTESDLLEGFGNIFSINNSGNYTIFAPFNSTNGANGFGSLCQAKDSNFYGMTFNGGIYSSCVCFKCTKNGTISILFDFLGPTGDFPFGNVIQASNGYLYGMTTYGGNYDMGTLWVKKPSDTLTKVLDFNDTNGACPYGSMIEGADGKLYGMTSGNANYPTNFGTFSMKSFYQDSAIISAYGTIFSFDPSSGIATTLYQFDSINGAYPTGSLLLANDGNFYGLTSHGGNSQDTTSYGTLFQYSPSGSLRTLVKFNGNNGSTPFGSLIQASDGYLYGMTNKGGSYNMGTIFKCDLSGNLTTLVNFNGANGAYPFGDLLEVGTLESVQNITNQQSVVNIYPNPNAGSFYVSLESSTTTSSLILYNILGQEVYSSELKGSTLNHIYLPQLVNGVYLYKVLSGEGNTIGNGKLVIQH